MKLFLAPLAAALLALQPGLVAAPSSPSDLVETAVAAGDFKVLTRAVEEAGLVDALRGKGPFTVFAPADPAFGKLPAGTVETLLGEGNRARLTAILGFHVVPGRVDAPDLARGGALVTLNGQRLTPGFRDGRLVVGGATVIRPGIACSNGVIHVIDTVLLPAARTLVDVLAADGRFGKLLAAAQAAGLAGTLSGKGPFTLLAPTDEAFAKLPVGTLDALNKDELVRILTHHALSGRVYAADALKGSTARTLAGTQLSPGLVDGVLSVSGARVVATDLEAANGVIHVIDAVLLPPVSGGAAERLLLLAIDRGVPFFNRGDEDACAAIYEMAVRAVLDLSGEALPDECRADLGRSLRRALELRGAGERAWELRRAMDRTLNALTREGETRMKPLPKKADDGFRPRIEAPLPEGFPGPGPIGEVVVKQYPDYRAAQAKGGGNAFWTLFQHIKRNDIAMTAPVEMEMQETDGGGGLAVAGMAFLYQAPELGKAGTDGNVEVVDLPRATVLSVGMRGPITVDKVRRAREAIGSAVESGEWVRDGEWRLMGYNSPMVPEADRFYEIQLPVRPAGS